MITRQQALEILHQHMKNQNLRRHCYAVDVVMRGLAKYFSNKDRSADAEAMADKWGIAGLLHDADYEETKNDPSKHVVTVVSWLEKLDIDKNIINAIYAHGWKFVKSCPEPKNKMEWSLYCCDELTGLIVAVALVRPDKKLSSVTVESVMKKWDVKAFAAGVNREQIKMCEEKLDTPPSQFITISLSAMQGIASELGL